MRVETINRALEIVNYRWVRVVVTHIIKEKATSSTMRVR